MALVIPRIVPKVSKQIVMIKWPPDAGHKSQHANPRDETIVSPSIERHPQVAACQQRGR